MLGSIFGGLWEGFWDAGPSKTSRVHETLIFIKLHFSLRAGFWMQNGSQKPPKMDPKSFQKHIKPMMHFLTEKNKVFCMENGAKGGPKETPTFALDKHSCRAGLLGQMYPIDNYSIIAALCLY